MAVNSQQYNVSDLAEFLKEEKTKGQPFVFFTGAGCSFSAGIPLAGELVRIMNERYKLKLKGLTEIDRQDYGKCMGQIGRDDRRAFLKCFIEEAKINWAHIALACLLKEGFISRVLTFNFDNLLARSCGLLGLYPATYDLTAANLSLYNKIDNPAIVHLHGQSHGFIQLNSAHETGSHAGQLGSFIGSTLNESPTLFIGYSGNADHFFPQIKEKYTEQHNLFWVDMPEHAPTHIDQFIRNTQLATYISCPEGADLFLIELARKLGCFPPLIFTDPYGHLLTEIADVSSFPVRSEKTYLSEEFLSNQTPMQPADADILDGLKNRLEDAKAREALSSMPNFLDLYLQGEYQKIIDLAELFPGLDNDQKSTVALAYYSLASEQRNSDDEIQLYDSLIEKFVDSSHGTIQLNVAKALVSKGFTLVTLERFEDSIAVCDQMLEQFGDAAEPGLRELVATAKLNKGVALCELDRFEESIAVYDQLFDWIGDVTSLLQREVVSKAMVNKGIALSRLGRSGDSIAVYDQMIDRFGNTSEPELRDQIARAMANKGFELNRLGRFEDSIAVYDLMLDQFGDAAEPVLRELVATAKLNKGVALCELDRFEESIAVYDQLFDWIGDVTSLVQREVVSKTMVNKGISLSRLGRSGDSIAVYDQMLDRFGDTSEPSLRNQVARAMANKEVELSLLGRS